MWIPKDERLLLVGYYRSIHAVGSEKQYGTSDFVQFLHCQTKYEVSAEMPTRPEEIEQAVYVLVRSQKANKILSARGLITCTPLQPGTSVSVSLTLEGYDLGRQYSNWFDRSGLRFSEYRNHWIWLIIAFIGGAVGSKLIDWMWSFLRNT